MIRSIRRIFQNLSNNLAIDLGSENTVVLNYRKNKGEENEIIVNPTTVAYNKTNDEIYIGEDADKLMDKTVDFKIVKPVEYGVIVDNDVAVKMIRELIAKYLKRGILSDLNFYIATPSSSNVVDKRIFKEVLYDAGASNVFMVDSTLATALGAGLEVNSERAYMILNIGSDVTEVGIVSMKNTIYQKTFKLGGQDICEALISIIKNNYNVSIGMKTANQLLRELGTFYIDSSNAKDKVTVQGKSFDVKDIRIAKNINIKRSEVFQAIQIVIDDLIFKINEILDEIPSDIFTEVVNGGIYIAGGVALIDGIDAFIGERLDIKSTVIKNPKEAIINGLAETIEMNFDKWVWYDNTKKHIGARASK